MNRQPSGFPGCESPGAAALPGGSRPGVSAARNGSQQLPPARCPGSPSILGPADSQGRRPVPGARDPCFYPETVPCVSGRLPRQADFSSPPEPPRLGCFPCRLVSFARLQEDSVWVGPGQADRTIPTAIKLDLGPGRPALSSLPLPATAANPEPRSGGPGALVGARFPTSLPNNQLVITQGFGGSWRGPFRSTDYLVVYYFEVVTRLCAEGTHRPEGAGSRGPLSVAHPAPRGSRGASLRPLAAAGLGGPC